MQDWEQACPLALWGFIKVSIVYWLLLSLAVIYVAVETQAWRLWNWLVPSYRDNLFPFFFFGSSSPLGMNDKKFLSSFFNPKIAPNQRILAFVISKHFVASDIPQRYNNFFRTLKWWEPFQIAWEKNIVIFSHHCYSSLSSVLLSFLLTLSVSETLYLDKLCLLLSVSNYMWVTRDINHVYLLALYF